MKYRIVAEGLKWYIVERDSGSGWVTVRFSKASGQSMICRLLGNDDDHDSLFGSIDDAKACIDRAIDFTNDVQGHKNRVSERVKSFIPIEYP